MITRIEAIAAARSLSLETIFTSSSRAFSNAGTTWLRKAFSSRNTWLNSSALTGRTSRCGNPDCKILLSVVLDLLLFLDRPFFFDTTRLPVSLPVAFHGELKTPCGVAPLQVLLHVISDPFTVVGHGMSNLLESGTWCQTLEPGGTWCQTWFFVEPGGTWWNLVSGTWWNLVSGGTWCQTWFLVEPGVKLGFLFLSFLGSWVEPGVKLGFLFLSFLGSCGTWCQTWNLVSNLVFCFFRSSDRGCETPGVGRVEFPVPRSMNPLLVLMEIGAPKDELGRPAVQRPSSAWRLARVSALTSNPNRVNKSRDATAASSRGRAINSV